MIERKDLFNDEHVNLLAPYSFEFLNLLIGQLGFSQKEYNTLEVKTTVLNVLKFMFELNIICIKNWMNNPIRDDYNMSVEEILNKPLWIRNP